MNDLLRWTFTASTLLITYGYSRCRMKLKRFTVIFFVKRETFSNSYEFFFLSLSLVSSFVSVVRLLLFIFLFVDIWLRYALRWDSRCICDCCYYTHGVYASCSSSSSRPNAVERDKSIRAQELWFQANRYTQLRWYTHTVRTLHATILVDRPSSLQTEFHSVEHSHPIRQQQVALSPNNCVS